MLKKTLLISLAALLSSSAMAEVLSPQAALQRASSQPGGRRAAAAAVNPVPAFTGRSADGQAALYVFNSNAGGSLILSASTLAVPVLGYTDSGSFDPANIPPQMQTWLEGYADQISYAEANNLQPSSADVSFNFPADWSFIAPLCKTKWDQNKPYNNDLAKSYFATGCVATAMAQVMKYHNYPEIGHGSNTYTDASRTTYSMNFGEKPFDWANMIDDYSTTQYTDAQAAAVAYLMKACGYSTDMTYGTSSGTQTEKAAIAFVQYFGYDETVNALDRNEYNLTEWATMLYDQLKNVGPVLYRGHSLGGYAHAFVCDGYDGNGYFHINWGWSGLCDGYYTLDAMNPSQQGTGGSQYGGYNFSQGMIINVKPATGTPTFQPEARMSLLGSVSATNVSSILTLTMTPANPGNLCNNSLVSITPTIGIKMVNLETGETAYNEASGTYFYAYPQGGNTLQWIQFNLTQFGPGSYIDPQMQVKARFNSQLPDGKYKVQLVWRDLAISKDWQDFAIYNGCYDYVYVTKSSNSYTIENVPMDRFVIDSAEILTPLYMRNPFKIQFTLTNPSDKEISQSIVPVLFYDGKLSFEGDSQLVTVGPKQTITTTLLYTFNTAVSGGKSPTVSTPLEYTLGAYDYNMIWEGLYLTGSYGESYYGDLGTVTMKRSASNPSMRMRSLSIGNAAESGVVEDLGFIYGINQFSNIELNLTVEGTTGFIASPLTAIINEYDPETRLNGAQVYEKEFEDLLYIESGETVNLSTWLHMTDFDVSKIYSISVYYLQSSQRISLGNIRFAASSGVGSVSGDEVLTLNYAAGALTASSEAGIASLDLYDLSGMLVASPACGGASSVSLDLAGVARGVYLVKATAADGQTKTLKIAL